jgi:cytochrome c553
MQSIRVGRVQVGSSAILGLAVVVALALTVTAHAAGNAAEGKAKSATCQACHVASGADTPHVAGQREVYIVRQLKAFKAGDCKNPLMNAIATQLSEDDIEDLAAYWSAQAAGSDTNVSDAVATIRRSQMPFPKAKT